MRTLEEVLQDKHHLHTAFKSIEKAIEYIRPIMGKASIDVEKKLIEALEIMTEIHIDLTDEEADAIPMDIEDMCILN